MLKIYFTASTAVNREYLPIYKKIIRYLANSHIISGRQITDQRLLKTDKTLTPEEIFQRQKSLIENADAVVAEVTKASMGVGGEIVYALTHDIPVLALMAEGAEDKLSPLVAGNPSDSLYLEQYGTDNLKYRIAEFVKHIKKLHKQKGALIVIDGGDGSGKSTQAQLLLKYLRSHKNKVKYVDFPQYYKSFHGKTVAKFLRGEFGTIDQVSPYLASLAYALDRASVKREMEDFLDKGGIIIANRYATSNLAHQGAKFVNKNEREDYLKWDYELEYKVHKIPKEKIVIYLHVPTEIATKLAEKRGGRNYLSGKVKDIHEQDTDHLKKTENMYLELAKRYRHWVVIECVDRGELLSRESIHELIVNALVKRKLISS